MRKLLRRLFRLTLFALVIVLGVVVVKTLSFGSQQIPVDPVSGIDVDDAAAQRLSTAIGYPTVSTEQGVDTAAFVGLDTFLQQQFPLVHRELSLKKMAQFSRLYHWPGTNPKLEPILLLAHLDVVPVEAESAGAWTVPAFSGRIHEGYIWGRGTLDDKESALAILEATEQLLKDGFQPVRPVYIALGHDEEVGGYGAQAMARYFVREGLQFAYVLDEGSLVVNDALPGLDQPLAMIGLSEKGYLSLQLTARLPEGGHSSTPPAQTAVGVLSQAITRLQENPFPARLEGPTRQLFMYAGPEMSLPLKAIFANLWLTEGLLKAQLSNKNTTSAMIRTTTAPTMVRGGVKDNVLPTEARAVVNFRIMPGETTKSVIQRVNRVIDDNRVTIAPLDSNIFDPAPVSETNAFGFQVLHKTIRQLYPEAIVAPSLVTGATDSRHYREVALQTYRFRPVQLDQEDISGIHGIDERISVANYKKSIQWYHQLIRNSTE